MKKKEAIILAPVMPIWDNGEFCAPLISILEIKGFKVSVIDTLTFIETSRPLEACDLMYKELKSRTNLPFLLIGFAMGGTLVQMLSYRLNNLLGAITISSPSFADINLKEHLSYLLYLLNKGDLNLAVETLHKFVVPNGEKINNQSAEIHESLHQTAINRMIIGFTLLLNLDSRLALDQFKGKYLSIIGEKSQLATCNNQFHSTNQNHSYACISNAGMRPWNDNAQAMNLLINKWIDEL